MLAFSAVFSHPGIWIKNANIALTPLVGGGEEEGLEACGKVFSKRRSCQETVNGITKEGKKWESGIMSLEKGTLLGGNEGSQEEGQAIRKSAVL